MLHAENGTRMVANRNIKDIRNNYNTFIRTLLGLPDEYWVACS